MNHQDNTSPKNVTTYTNPRKEALAKFRQELLDFYHHKYGDKDPAIVLAELAATEKEQSCKSDGKQHSKD